MGATDDRRVSNDGVGQDFAADTAGRSPLGEEAEPFGGNGAANELSSHKVAAVERPSVTGVNAKESNCPAASAVGSEPDIDVDATMRGSQIIFRRTFLLYVLACGVLLVVDVLTGQFGGALFVHVPFQEAAPILTVSATVAIGLHVAVFNLTHEKTDAPMSSDVLVRLDAFATGGVTVGIAAAAAGLLMLWPVGSRTPDGLDVLGASLSVVVVVVAGMAGHIVPSGAMNALDEARRTYNMTWLTRAADYWAPRPSPTPSGFAVVLAACVLPAVILSWATGGFAAREAALGLAWSANALLPPVALLGGLTLMLHRRYLLAGLASIIGVALTVILVVTVVRGTSDDLRALALAGCGLGSWVVLGLSLRTVPSGPKRVPPLPRVVRFLIAFSLQRRLAKIIRPSRRRAVPGWAVLVGWFSRATGRTVDTLRAR